MKKKPSTAPSVRPLVILYGSYRGDGKKTLQDFASFLCNRGINAYIVDDYDCGIPHEPGLDASLACVEACDLAVFVFFTGETINVDQHLECFDQGPMIEFAYLCLCKKEKTAVQVVFETEDRGSFSSSLLGQLVRKSPVLAKEKYPIDYPEIDGKTKEERLAAMKDEIRAFCVEEYSKRGVW